MNNKAQKELWLIWRKRSSDDPSNRRRYRIGILSWNEEENKYTFRYDYEHDFVLAKDNGFISYPGFEDTSREKLYESSGKLFQNISSRLPRKDRDDYLDILNKYDLDKSDDEFKILSVTRGRQVTDNFEFVPAFNNEKIEFEVSGVNHRDQDELKDCVEDKTLVEGAKLRLMLEEDSQIDKYAIKVLLPKGEKEVFLGYVPRYYNQELSKVIKAGTEYSVLVTKVDLDAPKEERISVKIRLIFA